MTRSSRLNRFERRVRGVRSWTGLAMGSCIGGVAASAAAAADWAGWIDASPAQLLSIVAFGALLGSILGWTRTVPAASLTRSIDRRARLDDRLSAAFEHAEDTDGFAIELREDAHARVDNLTPAALFPLHVGRWQAAAVLLCLLSACLFLLGNSPLLLSNEAKKTRQELQKKGEAVQRVRKENLEDPRETAQATDAEKRLDEQLRELERRLAKGRMSQEEALQKSDEIGRAAEKLMRQGAEQTQQSLAKGETAMERMQKAELAKAGLSKADPSMAQMSEPDRRAAMAANRAQQEAVNRELASNRAEQDAIAQKLKQPGLSKEERKALEAKRDELKAAEKALRQKLEAARKEMEALQLSKAARDVIAKLMSDPLYKQIQSIAAKLAKDAQSTLQNGQPSMSKEERLKLQKELEELAAKLKDDKSRQEYLKALLEAMKHAGSAGRGAGVGRGLLPVGGSGVGLSQGQGQGSNQPGPGGTSANGSQGGAGAPSEDIWVGDAGRINRSDKPVASQGKAYATRTTGDIGPGTGPETYEEIQAPTSFGNRSSIPYVKVLPSYRQKAQEALDHQQIPKEHQKRVKEYFQSLQH